MDLPKVGSVVLVALPALAHEVVDLLGGGRGGGQVPLPAVAVEEVAHVLDDLLVAELGEGLRAAEGEDFPQRHGERPHVALGRELALKDIEFLARRWGIVYLCLSLVLV